MAEPPQPPRQPPAPPPSPPPSPHHHHHHHHHDAHEHHEQGKEHHEQHERKGGGLFKAFGGKHKAGGGGGLGGGLGWGLHGLHLPHHLHYHHHPQHQQQQHQEHRGQPSSHNFFASPKSPLGHSAPVFSDHSPRPRLPPVSRPTAEAVMAAVDYLGSTALGVEGLYRVSGSTVDVGKLQRLLEVGTLVSPEALDALDKHVIAGAIKKVLQEHEPLVPYALFEDFLAVPGRTGADEKARAYRQLLEMLPPASRALLGHLLLHLKQVADYSAVNKMTAENLSITVGVNLLRPSEDVEGATLQRLERARAVVRDLINMADALFGGGADPRKQQEQASPPPASPSPPPPPTRLAGDDRIDGPAIRFLDLPRAVSMGGDGYSPPPRAAAAAAAREDGRGPPPPKPRRPRSPVAEREQRREEAVAPAAVADGLGERLDAVVTLARADSPPALEGEGTGGHS